MKIQQTTGGKRGGWVLFGSKPDGEWFERWFSTADAAKVYATKRSWPIEE